MKKISILLLTIFFLTSCSKEKYPISNQTWEISDSEDGSGRKVVKLNSVLAENLYFKFMYDPTKWELKESKQNYMTNLYLDHRAYDDGTCVLLPGTQGYEIEKDYSISTWSYRSDLTYGNDYEFKNPITGVIEMRVFETSSNGEGMPTVLFELHLPTDGQDQYQCYEDYQQTIGTYTFDHYEGTPEELQAILQNIEATKKQNEEIQKQKELEYLKQLSEQSDVAETNSENADDIISESRDE